MSASANNPRKRVEQAERFVATKQAEYDEAMKFVDEARSRRDAALSTIRQGEEDALSGNMRQQLGNDGQVLGTIRRLESLCFTCITTIDGARAKMAELEQAKVSLRRAQDALASAETDAIPQ